MKRIILFSVFMVTLVSVSCKKEKITKTDENTAETIHYRECCGEQGTLPPKPGTGNGGG